MAGDRRLRASASSATFSASVNARAILLPIANFSVLSRRIFARMTVHDFPADARIPFLGLMGEEGITCGRVYDAHIAEVARVAGAKIIVTDNRRHFLTALRYGG